MTSIADAAWHAEPPAVWPTDRKSTRVFTIATVVFAAAFVFHNADHLRRGIGSLTGEVLAGGSVLAVGTVIAITLVALRHRLAPAFAMIVGFAGAPGVAATHLLPTWSAFSDSFPDGHVDAISWAAGISEVVALVLFGLAGLYVWRREKRLTQA